MFARWAKRLTASAVVVFACVGCAPAPAAAPVDPADAGVVEEIKVKGFDPDGEPVIERWSDGEVWLHFEQIPPRWAENENVGAEFDDFDRRLSEALDVTVVHEDDGSFVISQPLPDTPARAKAWLEAYRKKRPKPAG